MKRSGLFTTICLVAAALLTACTQDEGTELGTALPEGQYPLQIGGITLSAQLEQGEASPQTRVSENADGSGSIFKDGDKIGVCIGESEETGIYVIHANADGTVTSITPETPVYWKDTQPTTVTAWYPVDDEIDFTQQNTKGLTYLLKGTSNANVSYNTSAMLTFAHQLAKVRVMLDGDRASVVSAVTVRSYPKSINSQGSLGTTTGGDATYVPMYETTYNGQRCWEATLRDGTLQANASFRLIPAGGGEPVQARLDNNISIDPGSVYNITITINPYPDGTQPIDANTGDITSGNWYVTGGFNETINITGGEPHIYLYNANVSVGSGSAISITGNASPTIHVVGDNNTVKCTSTTSSSPGAGIYVAQGSTVTITGSSRNDKLTTEGAQGGAGIGGNNQSCGNIEISNVTVCAYGSTRSTGSVYAAGIGGSGEHACGSIAIDNATVYAYGQSEGVAGNYSTPGIGGGLYSMMGTIGSYGIITIRNNSSVSVQRGSNRSDYIGSAGLTSKPASSPDGIDATVDGSSTVTKLN